jgi:rubrerythrin
MAELKSIGESEQKLFLLIKIAIEREVASQKMYKEALGYNHDPLIHELLEQLYHDEQLHEKKLIKLYNKLRKDYEIDGKPISKKKV